MRKVLRCVHPFSVLGSVVGLLLGSYLAVSDNNNYEIIGLLILGFGFACMVIAVCLYAAAAERGREWY